MTPTIIQAPPKGVGVPQSNVIPAFGEMTLDVRVTPGIGAEELHAELETLCRAGERAVPGLYDVAAVGTRFAMTPGGS